VDLADQAAVAVKQILVAAMGDLVRPDKVITALQAVEVHEVVAVVVLAVQAAVQMAAPANAPLGFPAATGLQGLIQVATLQAAVAAMTLEPEVLEVVALGEILELMVRPIQAVVLVATSQMATRPLAVPEL
tara:strand:- start:110 stop:502 length:393 start_codon:yes stop_codon:yes gene_type:complete